MNSYISADGLVRGYVKSAAAQIVIALLTAGVVGWQTQLVGGALAGTETSAAAMATSVRGVRVLGWLEGLATLSAVVNLFTFLGRANHNARALGADDLPASPLWTMVSFLVPIINYWVPYQILRDIWKASAPEQGDWKTRPGSTLLLVWWIQRIITYSVAPVAAYWCYRYPLTAEIVPHTLLATRAMVVAQLLYVVQHVLSILFVRALQRRQLARQNSISVVTSPPRSDD